MDKIKMKHFVEGDSRTAGSVPPIKKFDQANDSHRTDVKNLIARFNQMLEQSSRNHDWTKTEEPYRSMFYRDLCDAVEGKQNFMDGEWAKVHYKELERHHLNEYCPSDVNLFDVIEMVCDCVCAGMTRKGNVSPVEISGEILECAVANTVNLLKDEIEVVQ